MLLLSFAFVQKKQEEKQNHARNSLSTSALLQNLISLLRLESADRNRGFQQSPAIL